jgi:hypothetical protein
MEIEPNHVNLEILGFQKLEKMSKAKNTKNLAMELIKKTLSLHTSVAG